LLSGILYANMTGMDLPAYGQLCLSDPQILEFDVDSDLNPILAGQDLSFAYANDGIFIEVIRPDGSPGLPIAFDSSNPTGGDFDLGTPNEIYGGPGVGAGGSSNDIPLGNLLISAERFGDADGDGLIDVPDDDANGAQFHFFFDTPTKILSLSLVDIENSPVVLTFFDSVGSVVDVRTVSPQLSGDNSVITGSEFAGDIAKIIVELNGEGAIDNLVFCPEDNSNNNLVGGSLIPIDSTSLVLAGTQLTAAWLIPVIVSAAGIGLVFLRRV